MAQPSRPEAAFRAVVDPVVAEEYRKAGWWGDRTFAGMVHNHAQANPEGPAFITPTERLSWTGYDRASDRLAGALIAAGNQPGDRVAVLLPDGPTVHVAFVAAEKAGLTVVGIGARAGNREIRHLLTKTGATTLVTFPSQRGAAATELVDELRNEDDGVPALTHHVVVPRFEVDVEADITVDGDAGPHPAITAEQLRKRRMGPDDLFLVNSTSGTTGLPKCVIHTQNRWFYFHQLAEANADMTADDIFLSAVPAPFGFGIWTTHATPTILGCPTVLSERFSAEETLALIERERVSILACVSTQFIMLLNSADLHRRDLSSLRAMFTGGEAVPYSRAREFEEMTGAAVLQFYGSNETGVLSGTTLRDSPERRLRTAGKVVPEMQVRLFDAGEDVTASGYGQPGCRGPATSVGYLDDPGANRQLFTEDGWMLMGDLCTVDDEGYLCVVGRTSDIIIRGGKNISAAQVEDEVASHPAVALVGAVAMDDPVFGERVCVYVQLHPGHDLGLEELVSHLLARGTGKELLPERLIVMDQLPMSSGSKVAKGELREDLRRRMQAESEPGTRGAAERPAT